MVVGAGRGPLVRSAFNAASNVRRKIKMYVIEKNPNAIVTLTALQEELWPDKGNYLLSSATSAIVIILPCILNRHDDYLNRYEMFYTSRKGGYFSVRIAGIIR